MFREFDRATNYGSFFSPFLRRTLPIETSKDGQRLFRIEVDLTDFKPEDIQVSVKKGEVIIKAKSEHSESNIKQNREFNYRYSLPEDADIDKVRSLLKTDGRLVIEAPLPQVEAKADKEIPIKKEVNWRFLNKEYLIITVTV